MSHIVSYIFKTKINSALTLPPGFISFTDFRGYQNLKKKNRIDICQRTGLGYLYINIFISQFPL